MGALLLFLKIKGAQLLQNSWLSSGVYRLFKLSQRLPYTPIYIAMFVSVLYIGHLPGIFCNLSLMFSLVEFVFICTSQKGSVYGSLTIRHVPFIFHAPSLPSSEDLRIAPLFVPECRYSHHLQLKVAK